MQSGKHSVSSPQPSRQARPNTSSTSEVLTPCEIEALRRSAKEASASARSEYRRRQAEKE